MEMFLAMAFKPFIAFFLFAVAYAIARGLARTIPNGRIKTILFDRSIQQRHPWKFFAMAALGIWGVVFLVVFLLSLPA